MFTFINEIFIIHVTSEISESWNFLNFSEFQIVNSRGSDILIFGFGSLPFPNLSAKVKVDVDGILVLATQCWWQNKDFGDRHALKSTSKQLNKTHFVSNIRH